MELCQNTYIKFHNLGHLFYCSFYDKQSKGYTKKSESGVLQLNIHTYYCFSVTLYDDDIYILYVYLYTISKK